MSFSRPIQWYYSLADPNWPDGTFKYIYVTLKESVMRFFTSGFFTNHLPSGFYILKAPTKIRKDICRSMCTVYHRCL